MDKNFIWFVWFILMTLVAYLLIPRRQFLRLLPLGIVAGFLLVLAIFLLNVPLLGIWAFDTIPNSVVGVPLSLPLVWIPITMLFAYYVPKFKSRDMLTILISGFAAGTTLVQGLSVNAGIMRFVHWDLLATLLLSFSLFSLFALFLLKYDVVMEKESLS